jgi:alkylation response protein AidB-like acyl-CoA dehydrogenase
MQSLDGFFRESAVANEERGVLLPAVFAALASNGVHKIFVPRSLGGLEATPLQGIQLIEQLAYSDGSTGWVAFVTMVCTAMASGYLSDAAVAKLFAPGKSDIFCGSGAPTGKAVKVEGGYQLRGRWSYGSGIQHADWAHTGAILFENDKPKLDADGTPQLMIVHAPRASLTFEGNWDSLGLRASGSVDYAIADAFIPDEYVFSLRTAVPMRRPEFFNIGVINLNAIGHSAWAAGVGRRALDEIAAFARTRHGPKAKTASAGATLPESEAFWESYGRAEGRLRSARAFLNEVWHGVEARLGVASELAVRDTTLIRLALNMITEAAVEAADLAYLTAGGTSLRNGVLQRLFRDAHTGGQHVTVSRGVLRGCGRELAGLAPGKVWALYELVDPA